MIPPIQPLSAETKTKCRIYYYRTLSGCDFWCDRVKERKKCKVDLASDHF